MTDKIDEYISAKLQACAINFDYYICLLFDNKYKVSDEVALTIQFSPLTPNQRQELKDNQHIQTNIKNFLAEFENNLDNNTLDNQRYAYRVLYVPVAAKRKGQADCVYEFISPDSKLANNLKTNYRIIKETEKRKYLPSDIVKIINEKGYIKFNMTKHTNLWKAKDAKNPKFNYGTKVAKTWYWYENWVKEVEDYCMIHAKELK